MRHHCLHVGGINGGDKIIAAGLGIPVEAVIIVPAERFTDYITAGIKLLQEAAGLGRTERRRRWQSPSRICSISGAVRTGSM